MTLSLEDVQSRVPTLSLSLSRVGVTNVEKVIRIRANGTEQLFSARLDCFVDLGPHQKGAHMSRFEEVVNDAIGEVVLGESAFRAETLAQHIAEKVRDRQGARRAEVHIEARYPEHKPAPVSGIETQEIYSLLGAAVAWEAGTRRLIGVRAQGMTACPCAQILVQARSHERLLADGFSEDEIERIFEAVPVATHNQRGLATLHIGCPESCDTDIDAQWLVQIVEESMSSEIYELMKRSDEGAVVEKAHRRPRFVEDCVREMIRGVVERLDFLTDQHFVSARQENLETIHQHNVQAERFGLLGEVRARSRPASIPCTICRCVNGSTARTELVGTDLSLETATWDVDNPWQPPRPGFVGRLHLGHETDVVDPVPVTFVVDGEPVTPRVLSHRWEYDRTETVYALTDSLRVAERKGVRGAVLCADWRLPRRGAGRDPPGDPASYTRTRDDDLASTRS